MPQTHWWIQCVYYFSQSEFRTQTFLYYHKNMIYTNYFAATSLIASLASSSFFFFFFSRTTGNGKEAEKKRVYFFFKRHFQNILNALEEPNLWIINGTVALIVLPMGPINILSSNGISVIHRNAWGCVIILSVLATFYTT